MIFLTNDTLSRWLSTHRKYAGRRHPIPMQKICRRRPASNRPARGLQTNVCLHGFEHQANRQLCCPEPRGCPRPTPWIGWMCGGQILDLDAPFVIYRYVCFDWMLPRSHHPLRAVTCQKCASSTSDILTSLVFSGETIPCSSLVYHCIIIYWLTMSYNCQMPLAEKRFKSSSC